MSQYINDFAELKKYRTELPNLYDDAELDVYEFRLLAHYKRVGTCTESATTTAAKCKMSKAQVMETRQRLGDNGFIKLEKVPCPGGFAYSITIVDLWLENFAKYSGLTHDQIIQRLSDQGSQRDPQGSQGRLKEESTTKGDSETRNIFRVYEENIGALTPIISDILANAEKDYGIVWVIDAITLAVKNKKRNWRYCETILARWREEGKDDGEGKPAPKEAKRPTVEYVDGVAVLR